MTLAADQAIGFGQTGLVHKGVDMLRRTAPLEWRTIGTHAIERADHVEICDCGPANHLTGPQFAVVNGVEYRTAQVIA